MNIYQKLRKAFHAEPLPVTTQAPIEPPTSPVEPPEPVKPISHDPIDFTHVLRHSGAFQQYNYGMDVTQLNKLLAPFLLSVDDVSQGVTTITYKINLDVNTNVNKLLRLKTNMEIAINDSTARIYLDGAQLCIEKKGAANIVRMGDLYTGDFVGNQNGLLMAMGKDSHNKPVYYDLTEAPHMLVAGTTGSGKSVFLHDVICSLIMNHPDDIEIIGIDMKGTEFLAYENTHNFTYISETSDAVSILADLCEEMDARYKTISAAHCRDIASYNESGHFMKRVVCIIDEFADLMLTSGKQVEQYVVRLAQKARACGIHLVIATQRPTANVITGLIKTNIPTRVSFKVTSIIDSRIILDRKGAETLNGHGDMLLIRNGDYEPTRIQAPFMDEKEIRRVTIMAESEGGL